jgi:nickel/cobalt transporter (NicO) family protein
MILGLNLRAELSSLVREGSVTSTIFSGAKARQRARGSLNAARLLVPFALLALVCLLSSPSFAQGAHHPFAVGANEGALGSVRGLSGWLLAKESGFFRLLSTAIRSAKESGAAAWGLAGLSLAYGIFHAAGPGHGKMVIASYMLANERALRRGIVIAFGAALLQGFSAVAIVGASALVFRATAKHMTAAANAVEIASYSGIVALGAVLVYMKGAALLAAWRLAPAMAAARAGGPNTVFSAGTSTKDHRHGPECSHFHAAEPNTLGNGFSWKSALLTMAAAGLRPCSGAILVLVFALSQGIFTAGVFAVAAMSLGTAATTSALASIAVLAKNAAVKYAEPGSRRALIAGRLFEALAAFVVLTLGLALLSMAFAGGASAN